MPAALCLHDRRQDAVLRALFDDACARIAPFLDADQAWGGSGFSLVIQHRLREAYPQLTAQQVQVLIAAARRVHRARASAARAA